MTPYAPPGLPPSQAADKHVTANAVLMCVLTPLHLAGIGSAVMNIARFLEENPSYIGSPFQRGELVGRMIALVGASLWAVAGVVWAPINAYGLFTRKRWARTSSIAYWTMQIVSCCCFPFGAYGLYSMLRADVKALFERAR